MGRLGLFCLILAEILVVQAMAEKSEGSELNPFGLKAQNKVGALGVVARVADQPVSSIATAIFAVVFCYIRVTRKRDGVH